ncbi:hypothetical protein SAMN04487910_0072 [Aquimarina amphilecti]|uniref:DUF1772 domain-containing protein n=1 Tax=Aquimarina amphilecti TaxID=1038014 RepID=A0A1H7FFC6_AQUAM|nr:hypothetical protein [Aquimarina amphilecti]SEK24883.1 hypothetical protein SAMN04487910_0072 [Aquimarina amphilecti]
MDLGIIQLILDFGLLVLILLVQLVVYPSFRYFQIDDLLKWHQAYTLRIGIVVAPLMIGQLVIALINAFERPIIYNFVYLILVTGVWVLTFSKFVPMHNRISKKLVDDKLLHNLIKINWLRTFLWLVIFLLSFILYFFNS